MLVRTPNWLGDCVMALESIAGIISRNRDTVLWSHPRVSGLFECFFPGTPVFRLDFPLPRNRFDRLLLLTGSFRSALLGFRARIPERTGCSRGAGNILLTRVLPRNRHRDRHHCLDYENLARASGCSPAAVSPPPASTDGHLAVFAGAVYGESKRWPGFPDVVKMTGLPAVFYGSGAEGNRLQVEAARCGASVRSGLPLPDLVRELGRAGACLGNDSGGVHLAAALGIPTVAVFCSTNPAWTAPRGTRVRSLVSGAECSPCYRRSCPRGTLACTLDITPEAVAEVLRNV